MCLLWLVIPAALPGCPGHVSTTGPLCRRPQAHTLEASWAGASALARAADRARACCRYDTTPLARREPSPRPATSSPESASRFSVAVEATNPVRAGRHLAEWPLPDRHCRSPPPRSTGARHPGYSNGILHVPTLFGPAEQQPVGQVAAVQMHCPAPLQVVPAGQVVTQVPRLRLCHRSGS